VKEILARLVSGEHLGQEEAAAAMRRVMAGEATAAQVAAFLALLRRNGETVEEVVGCAQAMRTFAAPVRPRWPLVVDTCGTGGDGLGTFNISTAAAFVVAASGLPVAKHGNRAASSRAGSADVLEAMGVAIRLSPEQVERCLNEVGIAFLFAQVHHPAMRNVGPVRVELGIRTVFNLLGPMTNPAGAQVQLIGVPTPALLTLVAEAMRRLGTRRTLVVHSEGADEATLSGPTLVADTARLRPDGAVEVWTLRGEDVGLAPVPQEALRGGSPEDNARLLEAVLRGEGGPRADVVCLNAGLLLWAAGQEADPAAGVRRARAVIADGSAWRKFQEFRAFTRRMAEGAQR